jgi:hypothetical protein
MVCGHLVIPSCKCLRVVGVPNQPHHMGGGLEYAATSILGYMG